MTAQKIKLVHGGWYRILYRTLKFLAKIIFRVLYRTEVHGIEKVPKTGRILVCANHISYVDPVVIGTNIPRYTYFMAKKELFKFSFIANLVTYLNAFPVKRNSIDRYAFNMALKILKGGNMLILFPEGTRSVDGIVREGKKGVGLISYLTGSDVLPIAVSGTNMIIRKPHKRVFFPKIKMAVGDIIKTDEIIAGNSKKEAISIIVSRTMDQIGKLYNKISG